jgi:hypothetical protein
MRTVIVAGASLALSMAIGPSAQAQSPAGMDHSGHTGPATSVAPAGQDAYAALAAIVAMLEADSTTDWTKVNIEALRQHLIAMNDVTLGARSRQTVVPGGARMDVTGDGRVAESIRSMLHPHAKTLSAVGPYRATVDDIPGGVRFTVTASDPRDEKTIAQIRGLGFSGLLTLGAHHEQHHLALARGQGMIH